MLTSVFGILLIAIGAFMSGSFAMPFDKVKGWKWENQWTVYALFGYVIVPLAVCLIVTPDFVSVLRNTPGGVGWLVFGLGAVYGISNLTFGLSLRYLGIALGFSLSLGLMMALGTLIPPMLDGRLSLLFEGRGGVLLVSGILLSLVGIVISGYAGYLKTRHQETTGAVSGNSEFDLKKGIIAAVLVGITGTSAAIGIEQGKPIALSAMESGTKYLFQDSAVFLILYGGAFVTTLIWCLMLSARSRSLSNFVKPVNKTLLKNYLFCAFAGFLWFINFIFFGMGKSQMGDFSFVAWGILMTLTIGCATLWGIYRGEWKGVTPKIWRIMWLGLGVLFAASFLIAVSSM